MTPQQIMAEHLQKKTEISAASRGGEEQKKLSAIHNAVSEEQHQHGSACEIDQIFRVDQATNQSIDPGFAIESRLTDFSTGWPSRIFLTGTSSFLPDIVRGTSGIA